MYGAKNGMFLQKLRDLIKNIDRAITMTVEQRFYIAQNVSF